MGNKCHEPLIHLDKLTHLSDISLSLSFSLSSLTLSQFLLPSLSLRLSLSISHSLSLSFYFHLYPFQHLTFPLSTHLRETPLSLSPLSLCLFLSLSLSLSPSFPFTWKGSYKGIQSTARKPFWKRSESDLNLSKTFSKALTKPFWNLPDTSRKHFKTHAYIWMSKCSYLKHSFYIWLVYNMSSECTCLSSVGTVAGHSLRVPFFDHHIYSAKSTFACLTNS